MLNRILKSAVIGMITTSAIKLTYNIDDIFLLIGINIVFISGSFVILNINNKKKKEELEEHEQKNSLYQQELLATLKDNEYIINALKQENEESIKQTNLLKEILNEIKNRELFSEILKAVMDKDIDKAILREVSNRELDKKILDVLNDKSIIEDMNLKLEKVDNLITINDKLCELELLQDIFKVVKNKEDLKDINDSIENFERIVGRKLDETKSLIKSGNEELIDEVGTLSDITKENIEEYSKINDSILEKTIHLGKINEHNINLLRDSYKVLNAILDN